MGESGTSQSVRALIPWQSGTFHVILASSLIGVMGVSLISPVLPELRPVFDVSDSGIGLIITAFTLPGIFITPFIGLVADRIGRKRVLIPLLFTFGISGAAIAFTTDFTIVLALRFIQGIGASALVSLAITLLGDIYEGTQLDALIGVNGSMIGVGAAFYPIVGGGLAVIRWNVPFLFFGVGILVGLLAVFVMDEPTSEEPVGVAEYLDRMYAVTKLPEALAIFAAIFTVFFVFYGALVTALPLLLSDEFGLTAGHIGPILAIVALTSATIASRYGRIAQLRSSSELIALGFVAYGSSLLGLWLAPSVLFIGIALLGFGVGFGITLPSIDTTVVSIVSEDLRAGIMGIRTSMLRLGQTLGPVAFTVTAETFFVRTVTGYRTLILLAGVVVASSGLIAYAWLRR